MSETKNYEVVVIGGGPAGSTVGALLAKKGRSVLVLERESFPRYHVGESMVTGMAPLMLELGVTEELDRRFQHKSGISLRWGREPEPWRSDFSSAGVEHDHAWHVTRSEFDKLLLDNARKLGADVVEEAQVTEVLGADEGTVTGVVYTHNGVKHRVESRYVVDASGQNRTLARKTTKTKWQDDLRNVAVWGYFDKYTPIEHPEDILIEAIERGGWMWGIPISKDKLSLGYVVSAEKLAEATREGMSQRDFFLRGLSESTVARAMIDDVDVTEVKTARDWSHVSDAFHGDGWLAVGDAAAFIDPLFSSGVWLGTSGSWLAAKALDAALENPEQEQRAFGRFEDVYRQLYSDVLAYVRFFMDPTRLREEYMVRAQEISNMYAQTSRVGFISLISGVSAVKDLVDFDPIGMDGLRELMMERAEKARAKYEARVKAEAEAAGETEAAPAQAGAEEAPAAGA